LKLAEVAKEAAGDGSSTGVSSPKAAKAGGETLIIKIRNPVVADSSSATRTPTDQELVDFVVSLHPFNQLTSHEIARQCERCAERSEECKLEVNGPCSLCRGKKVKCDMMLTNPKTG
jgi:hypothetical protein